MSVVVTTRLPPRLARLMEREAEARGISLSMLLREIVEEHYGVELGRRAEKPFILELKEILDAVGGAKMEGCRYREECPLKALGLDPSPVVCALCQVHGHTAGFLETSTFNPYRRQG